MINLISTIKIKLLPDETKKRQLLDTMKRFNEACDAISQYAFDNKRFGKIALHHGVYYDVRSQFSLSSQMTVRAIGKVSESYKADKKPKESHRFKPYGTIVYDERILSFDGLESASILTLEGRIKVPMIVSCYHEGALRNNRIRGQADLGYIDGVFYLFLVVDTPDKPKFDPTDWIGVDLGIVNIATTSDGQAASGAHVRNMRRRNLRLRKRLQAKKTKSAKRLLKKRRRKEQRFAADINHQISKNLVSVAEDTQRGIALEDLSGIRFRVKTVSKAQRRELSSWSFFQLRQFISYKAEAAGVPVIFVDPRNTSRQCSCCSHIDKESRISQSEFVCTACGYAIHADINAAVNIRGRAAVNQPNAGAA